MVHILMPHIVPEFTLFQMQIEMVLPYPSELGEPDLGNTPEVLNAVDVAVASCELVGAVIHPVVPFVAPVNESVVAFPAIAVDGAVGFDLGLDNLFERISGHIRYDLGVDVATPLEEAKHNDLLASASAPDTAYPSGSEVAFIYLNLTGQR